VIKREGIEGEMADGARRRVTNAAGKALRVKGELAVDGGAATATSDQPVVLQQSKAAET
jgi:hypothetical protein